MALAKVKLTERVSGKEYLLAATKMNLKGILVETRRTLPIGTLVHLSLQLDDGRPLELEGEVHKIAERGGGGTGMIIRFTDTTSDAIRRIEAFARRAERHPEPASPQYSSNERTMMVDMNTLSKLTLSSADEGEGSVASTVDEEAVHAANPGFGGETRIGDMQQFDRRFVRKQKGSMLRWTMIIGALIFIAFTLLISSGIVLRYLDRTFGLKSPTELATSIEPLKMASPIPTPVATEPEIVLPRVVATSLPREPQASSPVTTPAIPRVAASKPPEERSIAGRLDNLEIEKGATFIKVIVKGSANFSRASASRAMSPRRLMVQLPNVSSFSYAAMLPVTENPLLRVRTEKSGKGVRLTLDLYPVEFPRYDLKPHADSLDIFLHR